MHDHTRNDFRDRIEDDFRYHSPKDDQPKKYEELRSKGKELAIMINSFCPTPGPGFIVDEKQKALEKLQECIMWANAAIARNS